MCECVVPRSVSTLNRVFKNCGVAAEISCDKQSNGEMILSSKNCSNAVASINHVIERFNLPHDHTEDVKCIHGKYIVDATDCAQTATTLNNAIGLYTIGGFHKCIMTTATTSPTSTRTTSPTTTRTTTQTTSPTTSQTTSRTTSRTTTQTTSQVARARVHTHTHTTLVRQETGKEVQTGERK